MPPRCATAIALSTHFALRRLCEPYSQSRCELSKPVAMVPLTCSTTRPRVTPQNPPPGESEVADRMRARRAGRGLIPLDQILLNNPGNVRACVFVTGLM